jgi:hypothetical protein
MQLQQKQDDLNKEQCQIAKSAPKSEITPSREERNEPVDEVAKIIQETIQILFSQYTELFDKAKIYQIRKMGKLTKQIANYTNGHVQKQRKSLKHSNLLASNQNLIVANVLNILAKRDMIYFTDR